MPYVNNQGVNVYYESWGSGGTPIVFLHPWSANGYIWYYQLFCFAGGNLCVTLDHRGHGRSEKPPEGYSIGEHAGDVAAVMDSAGVERAVVVGNSIGGMIAMQLCLDHPDRVRGLVIIDSATGMSEGMPEGAAEAMLRDRDGTFGQLLDGTVSARSKRERPEILELMQSQFKVESNFPPHVFDSSIRDLGGVFNWNITDRLKEINCPTVVFVGEEDNATPVAANKLLADNIPGAQLEVIAEVGHFYQLERPTEFNAALRNFIKRIAR